MSDASSSSGPARLSLAEFAARPLRPGDFYHTPEGYLVFTAQYHLRRGYCCGSGCRHCPWKSRAADTPNGPLS